MTEIELIPLSLHHRISLQQLGEDVGGVLQTRVVCVEYPIRIDAALDLSRRQYHSGTILVELLRHATGGNSKLLAVTSLDLFLPILTFVFGQAQVNNRAAVYSTFRLQNEFYGLPPDPDILYQRALKEALHELGHTFGLRHCHINPCVMNTSTYVEDIDIKPNEYCAHCWKLMHQ